jgi:fructose-1,6-bisphosphatase
MPQRRTTFSKFIIEEQRSHVGADPALTALLNDIQTACKFIASAVSRGTLDESFERDPAAHAREILLRECEWGGQLGAAIFEGIELPYQIPAGYPRGRYLVVFDPLDGAPSLDVNVSAGTIFSVLAAPEGIDEPRAQDFLQPGTAQLAAGFALYGPTSWVALTLGSGVHGFTLDREIGAYTLTHPDMRIPEASSEVAIHASNERYWEAPVQHYVDECVEGQAGQRGEDFHVRRVDSLVAEVHRLLVRGGVFISPRDVRDPATGAHLLYDANPVAMIVEQAGGAASTGRARILDVRPESVHARVPMVLGAKREVERVERYYATHDNGEELVFETPLFNTRSLFRTV